MKKYIYIPSIHPKICRLFYLTSLLLGTVLCARAQVTISLDYKEKNNLTTVQSGDKYTLQLDYSVSSTTGNASNVKAVINLPDNIYTVGEFVGTTHAPVANFVFTNTVGAKKLTINFINPVPSGSTGVLEFIVRTNNLTTPNNTQLCTTAEITDGSGATSGVKNQCINVTAIPRICAQKTLLNGGAVNNITTYRVRVSANGGSYPIMTPLGTLQATNITITDNLPANAEFISAKVYNLSNVEIGTGTYSAGVVTATIPDLALRQYGNSNWESFFFSLDIQVKFNSPTFDAADVVTNTATVAYTPFTGSAAVLNDGDNVGGCTSDLVETTTLVEPVTSAVLTKSGSGNYYPDQPFFYTWNFNNTGNVPLENVEVIETIPSNVVVDGVRVDDWARIDHIEYQTNTSGSTWIVLAHGVGVPNLASGTSFTKIKFVLISPFPANTALVGYHLLYFKPLQEVSAPEIVTNCMEWTSTTAGIPNQAGRTVCNSSVTLQPRPTTSKANYTTSHLSNCSQVLGGIVPFSGTVTADVGYADAINPVCALLIPAGFTYVAGSETFTANNSGITASPTLEIIPNYITTGGMLRDLYRWTFPSGTILPHGKSFSVNVTVKISPNLPPGAYNADFIATFSNASAHTADYNYGTFVDTKDWDLDGNTTELVERANTNYGQCSINVAASASMESIKWVKGLCDVAYSRYPAFGQTVPGGDADYRLIIKNTGNVVMKDIKIIDILPFVGDRGVIDPQARQSQWRPNLANPISAPSGVTVYYTTVSNPCRDEVKQPADPSPFPTGCTPPNWSVTPPLDITQVQAVKIDFGTKTLAGGDSLVFSWPMRAPVDAPTNDEIAWNSFGFVATRTDNNQPLLAAEPIKVGIKLKPLQPALYGDYVWVDANKNGIQDDGATGVSGVRVELYKDNGDGISDPTTDLFVGFTVTDGTGKYLFSTLQPGDYFAKFYPPAGYVTTTSNQGGNDALDSDGIITIVTTLDAGEDDRTWDLGIYQDTNCDVKITNYTLSPCVWTGTASEVTVNVFVAWANAPTGQNINVTLNGITQTIDLTTATSPALVSFTLPANNTDYVLNAVFSGTSTCKDSKTVRTPLPCQPAVCVLNIDAVNVGACKDGKAPLDIVVSWSSNPSGENIIVTAGDSTRIINVAGGVLSPVTVNFNMPSNGQVDVPINVGFQTTTACKDTDKFTLPNCVCIKPKAGDDVSVCGPATTAKLTAVTTGGTWAPIGSPANPAAATINANGNVTGMTVAGTYRFVYSVSGLNCTDTAAVYVNTIVPVASTPICHANGTPEDATDDYMTFNIHVGVNPMSANKFTVTATQGGNPLAVTLSNGSAATSINCGLNTPLRTPSGSAGKGNVTLTITDNVTGCSTTLVVTDPGTCAVTCVQGTPSTVVYQYATQMDVTELNSLPIVIPKFDEQGGTRVLQSVKLEYTVGGKMAFVFENRAAQSQSFRATGSSEATLNLNGTDIATNTIEMVIPQTSLPGGILVPATGSWSGDSIPSPVPTPTTLGRMVSWVSDYLTVFKDPRTDARWVTNATGDATDDDDMYINLMIADSASGTITYNTAVTLTPFIGTGSVPLHVSTLSGLSLTGGGGNLSYLQRTRAYASVKVSYTYICILCTKPVAVATPKVQTICVGNTVSSFTASPIVGVDYKWYGPLADTTSSLGTAVSGATSATFTPSGAALTTAGTKYYAVVVNTTGDLTCADTAYVRLVVNAKPAIADGSATICAGETVDLTSKITNYNTYLSPVWTIGTASGMAVATPSSVKPTGTTTYVLVAQNAAGCKDTANVVVTVNPKPNAGKDTTLVCSNGNVPSSVQLSAMPMGGTWSALTGNPTGATVSSSGLVSITNATAQGKSFDFVYLVNGCQDTVKVIVPTCLQPKGSLGDYVWKDTNDNGLQDEMGTGVQGVLLELYKNGVATGIKDTTDAQGKYLFVIADSASYQVKVLSGLPPGCVLSSKQNVGGDDSKDSDFNPSTALSDVVTVNPYNPTKRDVLTVDAGLVVPCVESSVTMTGAPVCSADVQTYSISFTITNKLGIVKVNKGTLSGNNPYTVSGIPSGQNVIITDSLSAVCKSDTTIAGVNCNCNPALPQLLTPSLTACIGDTFPTLKATVVGLATVEWFSQQTGGTVLSTGLNYKPSGTVTTNTVFYAQARSTDPTCPTAVSTSRVPATINAQSCIDTIDLALKKSINTKIARVGDVLTYTIKVWNEWNKNATGVEVTDSIATTVQFVSGSFVASRGSATISGNVIKWNIGNIAANGDTVTLRYQVRATQAGVHLNTAEISKTNEKDRDSTPGNGKGGEDDIDQQCFTVPFELCPTQKLEVSVPASLTNVQWYKNGGTTAVATGNVVLFSEVGTYTFTATNQTCPANGCCPVIIEAGTNCCPVDICVPFTVKKKRK